MPRTKRLSAQDSNDSSSKPKRIISSRRDFLKGFGAATLASAVPMAALAAHAQNGNGAKQALDLNVTNRRIEAFHRRVQAAKTDAKFPVPAHPGNGDESLYPNGIGNFTKGFKHDNFGEIDPASYSAYLAAVRTGKRADFDSLEMGGTVPLVDPQAGLAFDLESIDVSQTAIPPVPTLASPERAAEAMEVYWMALTRDVPFSQYGSDSTAQAAAAELNANHAFKGPRDSNGNVTGATLFRGFAPGDLAGPFISQLLIQRFNYGAMPFSGYLTDLPLSAGGADYMTSTATWLKVQNGQAPFEPEHPDSSLRYTRSGRDLAAYVHVDVAYQAYLNAALILGKIGAHLNSGNPYTGLKSETGFITFGMPMVQVLVAEVASRALKNAWYQKWFVHRAIRPEEYGGLVHFTKTGDKNYPLDTSILNSQAVQAVFNRNGSYLLPMSYPEGCPQHPSYPQGHGTLAGASVTILKWFFDENFIIPNPVVATDDGTGLTSYTGADAGNLTVGGEINKLASNIGIGRNIAGVHWRSDYQQSLLLGEAIAISVLRDQKNLYNENFTGFTFTKFDGNKITI
jgi:hypothetical protein